MEWRQGDQIVECHDHVRVGDDGCREPLAAMDDPMHDRIDRAGYTKSRDQRVQAIVRALDLGPGHGRATLDEARLERPGAGIQDEDAHGGLRLSGRPAATAARSRRYAGHVQSRMSAGSSPCSYAKARASSRLSTISWRRAAAR